MSAIIRVRDVRKSYHDGETTHIVLDQVSFDVNAGEVVALIGPSGSGKSTLLNLIGGIDAADSGTVEVAGNVLNGLDDRARTLFRRQHIGFVFQFFNLVPTLTVEDFPIDHVIARQHGGPTVLSNLALSCLHCNSHKGPNIAGIDPKSKKLTKLFNPRRHKWGRHFRWDGPYLIGRTLWVG